MFVKSEQLGRVTNICSDKTGTITKGKMCVTSTWIAESDEFEEHSVDDGILKKVTPMMKLMALIAGKCNASHDGIGQHTDVALMSFAKSMGYVDKFVLLQEFPFDSSLKRMTSVVRDEDGKVSVLMKGSTETVLPFCTRFGEEDISEKVLSRTREMAELGLRVILVAARGNVMNGGNLGDEVMDRDLVEKDLICVGAIGLRDPPRDGVLQAVQDCHRGGISVHMLTGDDLQTATSIAKAVSVASDSSQALHARDFDTLSDEQIDSLEELPHVIARCTPESKVKMVNALRRRQLISAMTGLFCF